MLKIEQKPILKEIVSILEKAKQQNKKYISIVEKVNHIHPVNFFAKFNETEYERYFWKEFDHSVTFVGIGVEKEFIVKDGSNRYNLMKSMWEDFLKDVYINDQIRWTGPLIMGGFSFFDIDEHSDKWSKYPQGKMILPKVLLSVLDDGTSYLTYNFMINENTSAGTLISFIENIYNQIQIEGQLSAETNEIENKVSKDYSEWEQLIDDAVNVIKEGKLGKVVLARELEVFFKEKIDISNVIKRLYEQQLDSYVFAIEHDGDVFLGATPERLVKVSGNELLSTCLAGTISRGQTNEEDVKLASNLLNDEKNRQEHQYVVDMIRQAIEPYCEQIQIPIEPTIYKLRSLQHLYTPVTAVLKENYTIFNLVKDLHPTPALGGDPTELAKDYIFENEPFARGWYAAPIGWVDHQWNGEFAVAIRSALVQKNKATLFAGCGIVKESNPKDEFEETNLKFTPMLEALGGTSE